MDLFLGYVIIATLLTIGHRLFFSLVFLPRYLGDKYFAFMFDWSVYRSYWGTGYGKVLILLNTIFLFLPFLWILLGRKRALN